MAWSCQVSLRFSLSFHIFCVSRCFNGNCTMWIRNTDDEFMFSEFEMLVFYLDVKRALTNSVSAPSPRGWGLPRPGRTPGVTQTHSDGGCSSILGQCVLFVMTFWRVRRRRTRNQLASENAISVASFSLGKYFQRLYLRMLIVSTSYTSNAKR